MTDLFAPTSESDSKRPELYLLDAYALIFRAYYAFINNPRINSKGQDTSAVFGFVLTLQDLLEKESPDAIAVAFDLPGGTFRNTLYPEYKAQREAAPEGIITAVPYIRALLKAYGIPTIEVEGFEADDVIGTLAQQAEQAGWHVRMVTSDKDYAQLVTPNVEMYRPSRTGSGYEVWGPREVLEKYGLRHTRQMIDYLGLVGDASDNVPGCTGIGPKSAQTLLQQYETIEEIYDHLDELKPAMRKKLEQSKEQTLLSKQLVTIVQEVPVQFTPDAFLRKTLDASVVKDLFAELEFRSLVNRVLSSSTEAPFTEGLFATSNSSDTSTPANSPAEEFTEDLFSTTPPLLDYHSCGARYRSIDSMEEIEELAQRLSGVAAIAFDTETEGLDALRTPIVGLSLSDSKGKGYFIPLPPDAEEATRRLAPLRSLMNDERILKVAHNAKFDIEVITRYGLPEPKPLFDTMIAHYLLEADQPHGMDHLAQTLLGYNTIKYSDLSPEKNIDLRKNVDPCLLCDYASEDADITLQLYQVLSPRLDEAGMRTLFEEIEMPIVSVLTRMEQEGVALDTEMLFRIRTELNEQLNEIELRIYAAAGTPFNINSPKQVGQILFEQLCLVDKPRKTKSGAYQTGEEILVKLQSKHPIVGDILLYREVKKLLTTYVDALPQMLYPDGKLHTSFNQAVAATGRLSSSNPNLQNIPIRTDYGRKVRAAFVADAFHSDRPEVEKNRSESGKYIGAQLLSADYSQVELRMIAHLSNDPALIAAFNEGVDIHTATAARIFDVEPGEVTPSMRSKAKTANFGINYGITPYGLSERLNIPVGEAKELIDTYFSRFGRVKEFMQESIESARKNGYALTSFGRRRYLHNINSRNGTVRSFDERNAINAPIQGTAADVIKRAMIEIQRQIDRNGMKSRMILQVHDELVFNVFNDEMEQMQEIVRTAMQNAWPECRVPLLVEMGTGHSWLDAH